MSDQIDITSNLAYGTSGVTVIAGLTLHELGVIVSIIGVSIGTVIAIGTFFINLHFKKENLKLNMREKKRRK